MLKDPCLNEIICKEDEGISVNDPGLIEKLRQVDERVRGDVIGNFLQYTASMFNPVNNSTFVPPYTSQQDQIERRIADEQYEAVFDELVKRKYQELLDQGVGRKKAKRYSREYVSNYFESLFSEE